MIQLLRSAVAALEPDGLAVVLSRRTLSTAEKQEILRRVRFFAPTLANRTRFRTFVSPIDLLSSRPILTFGERSMFSRLTRRVRCDGVFNIDYRRNHADGAEWLRLSRYLDRAPPTTAIAHARLRQQVERLRSLRLNKCYILGTGSSLARALERDWSDGYRIVCNTIVRDQELWNHINPHFIVAADTIYHFGFTDFARAFRRDLATRLAETETYFLYPDRFHVIVARELGEHADRLIPVPQGQANTLILDMVDRFELSALGNILNILLLPLGCTLNRHVCLWGFDGRAPGDKLFWSNSPKHSYPELLDELVNAHPAFFEHFVPADRPTAYVEEVHGDGLDRRLSLAEEQGWTFEMMHNSWTPALQKRLATRNSTHGVVPPQDGPREEGEK